MSKQGALYLRLIGGVLALLFGLYLLLRLCCGAAEHPTVRPELCEVGDGETVSGFVVRSEGLLLCSEPEVVRSCPQGQWVGAGQCVAQVYFPETLMLTAHRSGYFYRSCDGYESLLSPETLDQLSLELLAQLPCMAQLPPREAYGKLIYSQNWYFAAAVPAHRYRQCAPGTQIELQLAGNSYEMQVLRRDPVQGQHFLLILSCDRAVSQLLGARMEEAQLLFSRTEGLLIPREALVLLEGRPGVYVRQGPRIRFKEVRILSLLPGGLLIEQEDSPLSRLQLQDEILLPEDQIQTERF